MFIKYWYIIVWFILFFSYLCTAQFFPCQHNFVRYSVPFRIHTPRSHSFSSLFSASDWVLGSHRRLLQVPLSYRLPPACPSHSNKIALSCKFYLCPLRIQLCIIFKYSPPFHTSIDYLVHLLFHRVKYLEQFKVISIMLNSLGFYFEYL
jgi:hypothetical protein